ncbi:MAG: type II toxin-antitoxin system HicA family toxin [bacterium]|nr:type II toxin-antitoxin system HicA family toxin [bacterium]
MKIKQVKPKDLLKALRKAEFLIKRQKGSHVFLEKEFGKERRFTSIALHNEPLPFGTLRAILKQTGVSEEELKNLL